MLFMGEKVRRLQREKGVSSAEMAVAFGVPPSEISRWRYMQDMKMSLAVELAHYFGVTLDEFVNG
jgi:transcriptional regulator with XRE-family HTH domain